MYDGYCHVKPVPSATNPKVEKILSGLQPYAAGTLFRETTVEDAAKLLGIGGSDFYFANPDSINASMPESVLGSIWHKQIVYKIEDIINEAKKHKLNISGVQAFLEAKSLTAIIDGKNIPVVSKEAVRVLFRGV